MDTGSWTLATDIRRFAHRRQPSRPSVSDGRLTGQRETAYDFGRPTEWTVRARATGRTCGVARDRCRFHIAFQGGLTTRKSPDAFWRAWNHVANCGPHAG